ncbi:hypothetical protein U1Q18_016987 [Sarracenia purpurea var. burkii]
MQVTAAYHTMVPFSEETLVTRRGVRNEILDFRSAQRESHIHEGFVNIEERQASSIAATLEDEEAALCQALVLQSSFLVVHGLAIAFAFKNVLLPSLFCEGLCYWDAWWLGYDGEDIISNICNGAAAENAVAIMQERGFSNPRRSRHRLTPGTIKFAAFHILSDPPSKNDEK